MSLKFITVADVQRGRSLVIEADALIVSALAAGGEQRVRELESARTLLSFAHDDFGLAGQQELVEAVSALERWLARLVIQSVSVAA